jgi:archaeosortase A (PGF-CTERM-specific)
LGYLLLEALFVAGMGLFGLGFLWRGRKAGPALLQDEAKHLYRAAGWVAFGLYWFALFPGYAAEGDLINALGTAVALPVFLFLAYHETLSWRWREEYEPLRFLCGAAFIATVVYFAFDRLIPLSAWYIDVVANHSAGMLGLLGERYAVGPADLAGNLGWYRSNGAEVAVPLLDPAAGNRPVVDIVLACTAIQAFAVAAALIFSTRDPPRRKLLAAGLISPITYVMNLLRNTVVVHYYYAQGQDFDLVHSGLGKGLSLVVTAVLLLLAFYLLPELYIMLNGLYDLPWRTRPGWDYRANVGTLFQKSRAKAPGSKPPGEAAR